MQKQKTKTLSQFFEQRVATQLAEHFNVPYEELSTVLAPDIHQHILDDYCKDTPRWQKTGTINYNSTIHDVCLSEKEDKMAVALENGSVCVPCFDQLQYARISRESFHSRALTSQLYSTPASSGHSFDLLLCSSDNGDVALNNVSWTLATKESVKIKHGKRTNAIALDVQNKKIVTGSDDNNACIWDCKDISYDVHTKSEPPLLLTLPHEGTVWKVVISNDKQMVATASFDGKARVFDSNDGRLLCSVQHKAPNVCFVHITQDNKQLISAGDDGAIHVIDIKTNSHITTLNIEGKIYTLFVSKNDKIVAAGSDEGSVIVWDLENNNKVLFEKKLNFWEKITFVVERTRSIRYVSLNEENSIIAIGVSGIHTNSYAALFDIKSGKQLYKIEHPAAVSYAILNKSGSLLITTSDDGHLAISKPYTVEQTQLRKLLFLWTLVKKLSSQIRINNYLSDISDSLNIEYEILKATWDSLIATAQYTIWQKCLEILQRREQETIQRHEKNILGV